MHNKTRSKQGPHKLMEGTLNTESTTTEPPMRFIYVSRCACVVLESLYHVSHLLAFV